MQRLRSRWSYEKKAVTPRGALCFEDKSELSVIVKYSNASKWRIRSKKRDYKQFSHQFEKETPESVDQLCFIGVNFLAHQFFFKSITFKEVTFIECEFSSEFDFATQLKNIGGSNKTAIEFKNCQISNEALKNIIKFKKENKINSLVLEDHGYRITDTKDKHTYFYNVNTMVKEHQDVFTSLINATMLKNTFGFLVFTNCDISRAALPELLDGWRKTNLNRLEFHRCSLNFFDIGQWLQEKNHRVSSCTLSDPVVLSRVEQGYDTTQLHFWMGQVVYSSHVLASIFPSFSGLVHMDFSFRGFEGLEPIHAFQCFTEAVIQCKLQRVKITTSEKYLNMAIIAQLRNFMEQRNQVSKIHLDLGRDYAHNLLSKLVLARMFRSSGNEYLVTGVMYMRSDVQELTARLQSSEPDAWFSFFNGSVKCSRATGPTGIPVLDNLEGKLGDFLRSVA